MSKTTDKNSFVKLHKKITGSLVGNGVVFGALGVYAFVGLRTNPTPLWGISRHIALGVPLIAIAALIFFSGVGLGYTSKKNFAIFGAVSAALPAVFYALVMYSTLGRVPYNLITILLVALPLLLASRVSKLVKA